MSLCLLRRELLNEWQYHGVSMCEGGDVVSMCKVSSVNIFKQGANPADLQVNLLL